MNGGTALPLLVLAASFVPAVVILLLPEEAGRTRAAVNLVGAVAKLLLVIRMFAGVVRGESFEARFALVPGLEVLLRVDALSLLFLTLSAALWLVTTVYAISYLAGTPHQKRFFGFFSLCVTATAGIALAGTLVTFFVFYETLTLATWPLVVHRGTRDAIAAGRTYLTYTLCGSAALLLGIVWLEGSTGPVEFVRHGTVAGIDPALQRTAFVLMLAGLGVKAALVPLHGWLPKAMVAPAPVSALLHAVAVVKAGAFGIARLVLDVYGIALVGQLGLDLLLAALAAATILFGSVMALRQSDIKRRLAYSTVSQVSYIVLGVALAGPVAIVGGLAHLVHQGIMKITLFFCAGALAETLHVHKVEELDGTGRRMPWTMLAFSVAALGMIGVPPTAGFVSKWYLGIGGVEAGRGWVVAVLAGSALLNAAYFLPLIHRAWFRGEREPWPADPERLGAGVRLGLIVPPVLTAATALAAGLLAGHPYSPVGWATLIVARDYGL